MKRISKHMTWQQLCKNLPQIVSAIVWSLLLCVEVAAGDRQMETLDRGLVAVRDPGGNVFLSWRLLASDPAQVRFNIYRTAPNGEATKLNDRPLDGGTNYIDRAADPDKSCRYFVRAVAGGIEQAASRAFVVPPQTAAQRYLSIPLKTPDGYSPNDASVGDLDGDGEYEIVLHQVGRGARQLTARHHDRTDSRSLQARRYVFVAN